MNNPLEGEAMAIIFGLQLVGEAIFYELDVELDNS